MRLIDMLIFDLKAWVLWAAEIFIVFGLSYVASLFLPETYWLIFTVITCLVVFIGRIIFFPRKSKK